MDSDLELGQFRLLDVDNKLVIPVDSNIRLIVTGSDVLHSFPTRRSSDLGII